MKAKETRKKIRTTENRLKICEKKIAESPTQENLANLESARRSMKENTTTV